MRRSRQATESHWVSLSDVMTGLMVIFLFVAVAYMKRVRETLTLTEEVLSETVAVRDDLLRELHDEFRDDFERWDVTLDDDLSIRFRNPDVLFASAEWEVQPKFRRILDDFLPRYFDILRRGSFRDRILEVRVEGHTDPYPIRRLHADNYQGNLMLSQRRAAAVVEHFRASDYFAALSKAEEAHWNFRLTANGLSYGRMLDAGGRLAAKSGHAPDTDASRRVEFRIVTRDLEAIHAALDELRERGRTTGSIVSEAGL